MFPNGVHTNREAFRALQQRDKLKIELWKQHGVTLIHVQFTAKAKDMEEFIREELRLVGFINVPSARDQKA